MNKLLLATTLLLCGASAHAGALLKPTTGATQALRAKTLDVQADINGAFARTTVTTVYANSNDQRIEADFIYTAPAGAVVTGFAYWYGGEKVVARIVEKERAAQIYGYITLRMRDPALVEMVGKNTFRARIFPVEPRTDLKIEVQFAQPLEATSNGWRWNFPLRDETKSAPLDNFTMRVRVANAQKARTNLGALDAGNSMQIKRQNFTAGDDARVEVFGSGSLRHQLFSARDGGDDGFFALAVAGKNAPRISGVATYDVVTTRARDAVFSYGRYRGNGAASATANGQKIALDFSERAEKNNVASQLWAADRIEDLSASERNQDAVVALSKRFGMPSKWTSWLAIPEAERKRYKLEQAQANIDFYGKRYAQLVANGQKRAADQTKLQFDKTLVTLREEGGYYSPKLQGFLNSQVDSLLYERQNASTKRKRELKSLIARLRSAGAQSSSEAEIQFAANQRYMDHLIGRWNDVIINQKLGATSQQARVLVKEMKRWQAKRATQSNVNLMVEQAYGDEAAKLTGPLAQAIREGKEETPAGRKLWRELRDWQRRAGGDWGEGHLTAPFHDRAHNRAYRLAETESLFPNDKARIAQLKREVEANVTGKNRALSGGGYYYPYKISDLQGMIEDGESTLKYSRANSKPENRYRPGDPLISVAAPANCQRVVAILPSGELLPLIYDSLKKAWEARFDVPTYAREGAYDVKVIIVAADSTRHQMTMTFHVDVTAPGGKGGVIFGRDALKLSLQTDEQTDRVSAFTPWSARVELRRDIDGVFVAQTAVPLEWRGEATQIRFVVTDQAHNRTEVTVDWNE